MRTTLYTALALVCSLSLPLNSAIASDVRTPTLPNAIKLECTSCHIAYPPGLMSRKNWVSVMGNLNKHYGTDASVSEADLSIITAFFTDNASKRIDRYESASTPPRVTNTPWFQREHSKVPVGVWTNPKVKNANNCAACHTQAEKGSFAEREIIVPGYEGRKW